MKSENEEMLVSLKPSCERQAEIEHALYELELKKDIARSEYQRALQAIEDEQERILCELRALKKEGKR